jgi:hypothetical protein
MRISSSLLAPQPTELLRCRKAELRAQTITTHEDAPSARIYSEPRAHSGSSVGTELGFASFPSISTIGFMPLSAGVCAQVCHIE